MKPISPDELDEYAVMARLVRDYFDLVMRESFPDPVARQQQLSRFVDWISINGDRKYVYAYGSDMDRAMLVDIYKQEYRQ